MPSDIILRFDQHRFDVVQREGTYWFRSGQIAPALGVTERQVRKLHTRHVEKFGASESTLVVLPTSGGMQEVRVFSLRGLMKLAIYARTDNSFHFHGWLLDVADGKTRPSGTQHRIVALPAPSAMGTVARRELDYLRQEAADPRAVVARIDALLGGAAALPADPALDTLISDMEEVRRRRQPRRHRAQPAGRAAAGPDLAVASPG